MRALGLAPMARLAGLAPLVVRLIVGIIMFAHGLQKLTQMGPLDFGQGMLVGLDVPLRYSSDTCDLRRAYRRYPAHRRFSIASRCLPAHDQPRRRDPACQG